MLLHTLRRLARHSVSVLVALWLTCSATAHGHPADPLPEHAFGGIYPRISPAGESVLFSLHGSIWRLDRDGEYAQQLTTGAGFDVEPAWSADGASAVFIRGRNSLAGSVFRLDLKTRVATAVPGDVTATGRLEFDKSGTRLLGKFRVPGQGLSIGWLDLETGKLEAITAVGSRNPAALSPDSKTVAFIQTMDVAGQQGGNFGPQVDVLLVPASGGEPRQLVRFPARIHDLCWSADGDSLLLSTELGGVYNDIWQLPLSGKLEEARQLTYGQADEDSPSVSADGKWLLFTDNRHGPTSLVLRDLTTDQDVRLVPRDSDFNVQGGLLLLETIDEQTGKPITARVILQNETDGKYYAPPGSLYRMLRGELHFYCPGKVEFALPAGAYRVKICRGPEYPVLHSRMVVAINEIQHSSFKLKRWIDQRQRGWWSGESHIHANYGYGHWYNSPRTMLRQCAGEDLVVCNFMVANSDGNGTFDRQYFRGAPDPLSTPETVLYWNEEFRSTIWGHMTLLNLKELVEPIYTGFAHTTNPHDHPTNSDIADQVHDQDGHVNYTHPASNPQDPYLTAYSAKAIPIDVALGKIDSMDVMGSNHKANMPLWYKMLNCGFQLPAAAGTDCFLNRIPSRLPGQDRVYVNVPGDFSYQAWIENLQAGRTFVTNGPMLEITAAGKQLGETVILDEPGKVKIEFMSRSHHPINLVEIVQNGEVVHTAVPDDEGHELVLNQPLQVSQSGWLAVRVSGPSQADQPAGYVFAHTSPIYLQVGGKPTRSRRDAMYFVNWIDRLRTDVRKRNRVPDRHVVHVESQLARAREIYLERARGRSAADEPDQDK